MSNQVLKITCPHCGLTMSIPLHTLPTDKIQISGACGGCKAPLIIHNPAYKEPVAKQSDWVSTGGHLPPIPIPNVQANQNVPPPIPNITQNEDKTFISGGTTHYTVFKLQHLASRFEYYLNIGKNIIGKNAPIVIADDPYISAVHCCIDISTGERGARCLLYDDGSINNGKASSNGTFKFEFGEYKRLNEHDKILLENGTKLKIGRTELVFIMI